MIKPIFFLILSIIACGDLVAQQNDAPLDLGPENDHLNKSKIYNIFQLGLSRNIDSPNIAIGSSKLGNSLGVQHTIGYRVNQFFGVGLYSGFTKYSVVSLRFSETDPDFMKIQYSFQGVVTSHNNIAAGLAIRGELSQRKIRPYYSVGFEFNRMLRSRNLKNNIELHGNNLGLVFDETASRLSWGHMFNPSFGIQVQMKSMDIVFDLGYQAGKIDYDNGQFINSSNTFLAGTTKDKFGGFVFRIGLLL